MVTRKPISLLKAKDNIAETWAEEPPRFTDDLVIARHAGEVLQVTPDKIGVADGRSFALSDFADLGVRLALVALVASEAEGTPRPAIPAAALVPEAA